MKEGIDKGLIHYLDKEIDDEYVEKVKELE